MVKAYNGKFLFLVVVLLSLFFVRCSNESYMLQGRVLTFDTLSVRLDDNHLLLDGSLDSDSLPFCYNDISKLIEYLNVSDDTLPTYVYVAPWVYWVDNPDTPEVKLADEFFVPLGKTIRHNKLNIIGITGEAEDVIFASARGQMQGAVGNFTMFRFIGDDLTLRDVTFGNYCNVDLDYKRNASLSRAKRNDAITQAQLAFVEGDRAQAYGCRFISRLNTNPLNGAKRTLFKDCHFEMTDDALEGRAVYLGCSFDFYGGKPFYSTFGTGAVLLDCDFNIMHDNTQCFTKVEGQVVVVDCRFHNPKGVAVDWNKSPSGLCVCYQYNVLMNGKPFVMQGGEMGATVVMDTLPLLRAFKLTNGDYNLYNLLSGTDGWNPLHTPVSSRIPIKMRLENSIDTVVTGSAPLLNSVYFDCVGGCDVEQYRDTIYWYSSSDVVSAKGDDGLNVYITGENYGSDDTTTVVDVFSKMGHKAVMRVVCRPTYLEETIVDIKPTMRREGDTLVVDYRLSADNGVDRSKLTWYREEDGKSYPVAMSYDKPITKYPLTKVDSGKPIHVDVSLGSNRTLRYKTYKLYTTDTQNDIVDSVIFSDFRSFPIYTQRDIKPGLWTVDWHKPHDVSRFTWGTIDHNRPYWVYATGIDGTKGRKGLFQAQKGARLFYTPEDEVHGDMKVEWELVPSKPAGQGFGSATGQYLDLYVKFDLETLTGYALRIERTPRSSLAVDFSLVRYDRGKVTVIATPITAKCFRPDCKVVLEVEGTTLRARAFNILSEDYGNVVLEAEIEQNNHGGFGLQHTGSCGASAIMLKSVRTHYMR